MRHRWAIYAEHVDACNWSGLFVQTHWPFVSLRQCGRAAAPSWRALWKTWRGVCGLVFGAWVLAVPVSAQVVTPGTWELVPGAFVPQRPSEALHRLVGDRRFYLAQDTCPIQEFTLLETGRQAFDIGWYDLDGDAWGVLFEARDETPSSRTVALPRDAGIWIRGLGKQWLSLYGGPSAFRLTRKEDLKGDGHLWTSYWLSYGKGNVVMFWCRSVEPEVGQ